MIDTCITAEGSRCLVSRRRLGHRSNQVVFKCLELRASTAGRCSKTWYKMMSMLQSGLTVDKIITHEFSFLDYEKAFEVMNSGRCGKVVLNWLSRPEREGD